MKITLPRLRMDAPGISIRRYVALALCALLLTSTASPVFAQNRRTAARVTVPSSQPARAKTKSKLPPASRQPQAIPQGQRGGVRGLPVSEDEGEPLEVIWTGEEGVQVSTFEVMAAQRERKTQRVNYKKFKKKFEKPQRGAIPAPGAQALAQWPQADPFALDIASPESDTPPLAPQTTSTQFDGATGPTETGAFPPDTMGAVGPTQFVVFLNGRIRTFNKTTGTADGVLNVDSDVFFASVLTTPGANEVVFTSDPNVRYDRTTGRWFMTIIDVPLNLVTGLARANRVLIAVSDAASSNALTGGTVWTLYQFQGDGAGTRFTDYPSLGIDANALYIGADMFSATTGGFSNTRALIIPKAPLLTAAPATVFAANNLINTGTFVGPFAPRGVDNPDPANTGMTATGYFIGVDFAAYSRLVIRRVTNPGAVGGSPTISASILVTTPLTTNYDFSGQTVPHLGNTLLADTNGDGNADGNLDALDDRLYAAVIRNGRLWTAHNIGTNSAGVATPNAAKNTAANDRLASRWYELQNLGTTPAVLQSGTVFDNAAVTPRNYWIPSIAVSGQGHAALGSSIAGSLERVNAFTTGRLVGDTLGALRDGSPGTPPGYTNSTFAYNPPGDPGPTRRWGDYSFVSLDPKDDMTLWTIQEYCNGTNTYGTRAVKLLAPPPATPTSSVPTSVADEDPSEAITITGTSVNGSGFYDPGADPPAPHTPFNHISVTISGGVTVNSVTVVNPTTLNVNISTVGATPGPQSITVTNPDGQSMTGTALIIVNPLAPAATAGQVVINEFRFRGAGGATDEFTELYNTTTGPLDISGYTLQSVTAGLVHTVPGALGSSTTVIPARGHYLITGVGYSLAAAAASDGAQTGIGDASSIGFFAGTPATAANRIDSVGFNTTNPIYFEGTALTPSTGITTSGEYSFFRVYSTATGLPQDTDNNNADFDFVSTTAGTFSTRVSTRGAPGPENLASTFTRNHPVIASQLLDTGACGTCAPNRVRDPTPVTDAAAGTMTIRRTFTNNTGGNVTRLRYRVILITTDNSANQFGGAGQSVLRVRDSLAATVSTSGGNVFVNGTTLETPSNAPNLGGLNSSISSGTVTSGTPIAPGASINVQFVLGVQSGGKFNFLVNIEALP